MITNWYLGTVHKNHLTAGLCSVRHFPFHLWDCLIIQLLLTFSMVSGSCMNPKLKAWAQIKGIYDFNCTLIIVPPCIQVLAHEQPDKQTSWAHHMLQMAGISPNC